MPVRTRSQFIDDEAVQERAPRRPRQPKPFEDLGKILERQGVDKREIPNLIKLAKKQMTVAEKKERQKQVKFKKSLKNDIYRDGDNALQAPRVKKFTQILTSKNPPVNQKTTCIFETKKKRREGSNETVKTSNLNSKVKEFMHKGVKQYRLQSECARCGHLKSTFLSKQVSGGKVRK